MGIYTIKEHIERFSIWTAASAVRPPLFVPTQIIVQAIDKCGLKEISANWDGNEKEYEALHKKWCNNIINEITPVNTKCSYGIAAKIIAIYTKSAFVIFSHGESKLSEIAYPPIDSILLDNLRKYVAVQSLSIPIPESYRWSKLTEIEYFNLINILNVLRNHLKKSKFWQLEEFWQLA